MRIANEVIRGYILVPRLIKKRWLLKEMMRPLFDVHFEQKVVLDYFVGQISCDGSERRVGVTTVSWVCPSL